MLASWEGHVDIVDKLIKNGAKINDKKDEGVNAFINACVNKKEKVIELLLLQPNLDTSCKYIRKTGLQWLKFNSNSMYNRILKFIKQNNIQVKKEDK